MSEQATRKGPFPTAHYPVVFKVVTWVRIVAVLGALLLAGGFDALAFGPLWSGSDVAPNPVLVATALIVTLFMLYGVWWAFTAEIVLRNDGIEQRKPLFSRVLNVSDIQGRRHTLKGGYPMIYPRDGRPFSLDSTSYGLDGRFKEWFAKLPDLDEMDAEKDRERVRNDPALGATASDRVSTNAKRGKAIANIGAALSIGSLVLYFVGLRIPAMHKPMIIAALLIPWCAVMLGNVYKDQLRVRGRNNKGGVVVGPLMMPILILMLFAMNDSGLISVSGVITWGLIAGLPLWLATCTLTTNPSQSDRQKLGTALIFLPFAWLYGGSALALGNDMLDRAPPQVFETHVVGKHMARGKGGPYYYLELPGWGPETHGSNLRVSVDRYQSAKHGDPVCMGLHPGKFGFPWMHSVACAVTPETPSQS